MKTILFLLITLFIISNSIYLRKGDDDKTRREILKLGNEKVGNLIRRLKEIISSKESNNLFSHSGSSGSGIVPSGPVQELCNGPIVTNCKDLHTKDERRYCLTKAQICNQYKGQDGWNSLAILFDDDENSLTNPTKYYYNVNAYTFFNQNRIPTYTYISNGSLRLNNYAEIIYAFLNFVAPNVVDLEAKTLTVKLEERFLYKSNGIDKELDNDGKPLKEIVGVVSQVYYAKTYGGNYGDSVNSTQISSSSVYYTNTVHFDKDAKTIKGIYNQQTRVFTDLNESNRLNGLSRDQWIIEMNNFTCNNIGKDIMSQKDYEYRSDDLERLCGPGVIKTIGKDIADKNGVLL